MKTLQRIGLLSIPLTFIFAGIGMLWLLSVDNAAGSFFDKLMSNRKDWLGAHVVLLLSTIFLVPTAISIRLALQHRIVGVIANCLVAIIAFTSVLLAGQYTIDFIMPLLVDIGGDALKVHGLLFNTPIIDLLFYKLPNLVFLALFLLTCTLFWSNKVPRKIVVILFINWLMVLVGNLIHPAFQRIAIAALAFSFIPFVWCCWKNNSINKM